MEISIQTRDSHKSAKKYGTSVMTYHFINFLIKRLDHSKMDVIFYFILYFFTQLVLDRKSKIQCEGHGGYPAISNISASIKEKKYECSGSDETNNCFSTVRELQVRL